MQPPKRNETQNFSAEAGASSPDTPSRPQQSANPDRTESKLTAVQLETLRQALRQALPPQLKPGQRLARKPKRGFAFNPLRALPRNSLCPCKSGKKFKSCHLRLLPEIVTEETAAKYREQMLKPDLVFITNENQAQIAELAGEAAASNPV